MKKLLRYFFLLYISFLGAQEEFPESWSYNADVIIDPIIIPPIDFEEIRAQDSINDLDKSLPYRYGVEIELNIDLKDRGVKTILPDGSQVWRLAIQSSGAVNLSLNFNRFQIPAGARLQLYNNDQTDLSRSHTSEDNRSGNTLGTWFVEGDHIWVEYYQPVEVTGDFEIRLESVIHGYRMGQVSQFLSENRGLNDSGACNYDVNCDIGSDFESYKEILKKSVALLNLGNGYLCSAVLLNNIEQDRTPYLLTGNHCLQNSDPETWSVRFNWVSPVPVCGTAEDSADIQNNFTTSGASLRANNSLSDFALVELFDQLPDSWDISFAGWDSSDKEPFFEVGIHHPNGDVMKICRDDSGAVKENAQGTEVWLISGVSAGNGDGWEIGTTESGSSGSPLFNENGMVIGQLYAGNSFCDGLENNGDYDIYGRFGVSYNSGANPSQRLKDWLDPNKTGATNIETMSNNLSVGENEFLDVLSVYPNPASEIINVMNGKYPNLIYAMYDITGKMVKSGTLYNTTNTISVTDLKQGVYFLNMTDNDGAGTITKKIIVTHH